MFFSSFVNHLFESGFQDSRLGQHLHILLGQMKISLKQIEFHIANLGWQSRIWLNKLKTDMEILESCVG